MPPPNLLYLFSLSVTTIIPAFLLPARIVSKNYYYFANNSHLCIQFFFLATLQRNIVSVQQKKRDFYTCADKKGVIQCYKNVDIDDKSWFHLVLFTINLKNRANCSRSF